MSWVLRRGQRVLLPHWSPTRTHGHPTHHLWESSPVSSSIPACGRYRAHPSQGQTSRKSPVSGSQRGLTRVQEFLHNVLDRHQSSLLRSVEPRGCPQGRPLAAPVQAAGPAPGTPNSGRTSSQGLVTLEALSSPGALHAGACQGIRHVSALPCCLIYVQTGQGHRLEGGKASVCVGGC